MMRSWVLLVAVLLAAGCEKKPPMYPVSGAVTFDGQSVKQGNIRFVPTDGSILEDVGEIRDGKYSFRARPGPKRVEIFATREVPPPMPGMFGAREDYIPQIYNAKSKLTAQVSPEGSNVFDFSLKAE
jgi:hypothetical protein